jgi:60 kDa SS-A/Ro ribonucleoprotein
MSKFNKTQVTAPVINMAGGESYKQTAELELVSILLTSFADDSFYRKSTDTFNRLKELIKECDKQFVAKALVFARNEFGMRSITHVVASELAKHLSGKDWAKDFYRAVIRRPDDMMEILAYHKASNGKIPNSMKKGFAEAFDKFDSFQLAKYRGAGKDFNLIDVVRLSHPVPCEKNADAIRKLLKGELKNIDTWEAKLSKAGQEASNEDEKLDLKKDAWNDLILKRKIGYMALLKNLRNIVEQAPEAVNGAIDMLTDEKLIKKSLVLPFRFVTAYEEIEKINTGKSARSILMAINKATDISMNNVPVFEGDTLVVLDVSTSMRTGLGGNKSPAEIGALFASILVKSNNADFITFDDTARYVNVNPSDSTITVARAMKFNGGGTNFHSIFQKANKRYDRIIILSDMQGWIGREKPTKSFAVYKEATKCDPFIYSFDLKNYGTMQFAETKALCLAGFSDKVFDIMGQLEVDKNALVNKIKKVKF